jgi:hypothetical protein
VQALGKTSTGSTENNQKQYGNKIFHIFRLMVYACTCVSEEKFSIPDVPLYNQQYPV